MAVPRAASITIRGVDGRLLERLQTRARESGRSLEDEARTILSNSLPRAEHPASLAEAIRTRLAPLGGVDLEEHPPVVIGDPT